MTNPIAFARVRSWLPPVSGLLLAAALQFALAGAIAAEETPTPTETPTPNETATQEPAPTETVKPTKTPVPTATPTPLPAQDLAVSFFNNFCEAGQPLLATIFNTSATPLQNQTLRVRLSDQDKVLEEHDHQISLPAYGTTNLPLYNPAQPPWVKIEIRLVTGPADPNPNNDSASCGVAVLATEEPSQSEDTLEESDLSPGTSSRAAPPPASGVGSNAVWRQALPTPTSAAPVLQPTLAPLTAPSSSQPIANGPQPSLTPIGDAGGGLAGEPQAAFPSRTLMMTGVVLLAAGTSWAFYYLTRPKNA